MKQHAIDEVVRENARGTPPRQTHTTGGINRASRLGLRIFFWLAGHAPWTLRLAKPLFVRIAVGCTPRLRAATTANARRIFQSSLSPGKLAAFPIHVVGTFYDFVVDIARSRFMTASEIRRRIESIEGRDEYLAHRKNGRGAIIVTAHMGSFEVGLAALAEVEPHIHVVFKRDALDGFESLRQGLHETLGVEEAPIDEGWNTWMRLRQALESNHVVVMQGDRAMPGQKAQAVPVLGGHLMLPLGPVKLAHLTGSPIVPVFTIRSASGRCRVFAERPIHVDPNVSNIDGVHPALREWGKVIERFVAAYPEQWLVLGHAFVEDASVDLEV